MKEVNGQEQVNQAPLYDPELYEKYKDYIDENESPGRIQDRLIQCQYLDEHNYPLVPEALDNNAANVGKALNSKSAQDKALFSNCGIKSDRYVSEGNMFFAYLMGSEGMSFEDAVDCIPGTEKFDEYAKNFKEFLQNHPVKSDSNTPPTPDQQKNIGEWADIMMKASNKFREFKYPDIDYSDPKQVALHARRLNQVSKFNVDFVQETGEMFSHGRKQYAEERLGGKDAFNEMGIPFSITHEVCTQYNNAYNLVTSDKGKITDKDADRDRVNRGFADARINFITGPGKNIPGKTVGQLIQQSKIKDLYSDILSGYMIQAQGKGFKNGNEAEKYLKEGGKQYEQEGLKRRAEAEEKARTFFNYEAMNSSSRTFKNRIDTFNEPKEGAETISSKLKSVFREKKSPGEFLQSLRSEENAGLRAQISECFSQLYDINSSAKALSLMGIKDKYSVFKFNGKTPEEVWGKELSGVKNISDRELLTNALIINEICNGKTTVTIDQPLFDKNLNVVKAKPNVMAKSAADVKRDSTFFSCIKDLNTKLKEDLDELIATQADKEANMVEGKEEGSRYYRDMVKKMKACIEATDIENANMTFDDITEKFKEFQKSAKTYYKERDNIFSAQRKNGKIRKEMAGKYRDEIPYEIEKLRDLSPRMVLKRHKEYGTEMPGMEYRICNLWEEHKKIAGMRGMEVSMKKLDSVKVVENEYFDLMQQKDLLRRSLSESVNGIDKSKIRQDGMHLEYLDNVFDSGKAADMAVQQVKRQYLMKIRMANNGQEHNIEKLSDEMLGEGFKDKFQKQANKLVSDPDFVKLVNESKSAADFTQKWDKTVENRNKAREEKIIASNEKFFNYAAKADKVLQNTNYLNMDKAVEVAACVYVKTLYDNKELKKGQDLFKKAQEFKNDERFINAVSNNGKALHSDAIREFAKSPDKMKRRMNGKDVMPEAVENQRRIQQAGSGNKMMQRK